MSTTETPSGDLAGPASLAEIRSGVACVLGTIALLVLGVAIFFSYRAAAIAGVETWNAGIINAKVWPVAGWTLLFGIVLVLASLVVLRKQANDSPARLGAQLGLIAIVCALFMACIPGQLLVRRGMEATSDSVFLWAAANMLVLLVCGAVLLTSEDRDGVSQLRLKIMLLGGLVGLLALTLGLLLPFRVYHDTLARGLDEWRKNWDAIFWPAVCQIGGLALMFASLQLGRGMERESQNVRRLIYGYNAALTGLLLVDVLVVANVLAYAEPFNQVTGRPIDWTRDRVNSVHPKLQALLAGLKEDVRFVVMLPGGAVAQNTQSLMSAIKSMSSRVEYEVVSPTDPRNEERISELMRKYTITDPVGVLLIAGKSGGKTDHAFVKIDQFFEQTGGMRGETPQWKYKGENALFQALKSLTEGQTNIYFTQGHGEYKLDGVSPRMAPQAAKGGDSIGELKRRLTERRSVEVKPLDLTTTKKVPDDASVVVVANPTQTLGREAVQTLREYVQRKEVSTDGKESVTAGKLILLIPPTIIKQGDGSSMMPTGLEPLLAEHGVRLGNDRIISAALRNPLSVVGMSARGAANAIARAFAPDGIPDTEFLFENARTVAAVDPQKSKGVDRVLEANPRYLIWAETDLGKSPIALVEKLRADQDLLLKAISRQPLPLAVAVSEGAASDIPRDPAHAGVLNETPRMVVFGTSSWITDKNLTGNQALNNADLFSSTLSWVRGRTVTGSDIPPRGREAYSLNVKSDDEKFRLRFLPPLLFTLGVVGLGLGVWVVRRR